MNEREAKEKAELAAEIEVIRKFVKGLSGGRVLERLMKCTFEHGSFVREVFELGRLYQLELMTREQEKEKRAAARASKSSLRDNPDGPPQPNGTSR